MEIFPNLSASIYNDACYMGYYGSWSHRFYGEGGYYADLTYHYNVGIIWVTNKMRYRFEDPSILSQGEEFPSKRNEWPDKDVVHIRYLSGDFVYPPIDELKRQGKTVCNCHNEYGAAIEFAPIACQLSDYDGSRNPLNAKSIGNMPLPDGGRFGDHTVSCELKLGSYQNWWGNEQPALFFYWIVDGISETGYGTLAIGTNKPYKPIGDVYPSDQEIRQAYDAYLGPLNSFEAMIRRALDGDNFWMEYEGCPQNDALSQIKENRTSDVNWIENLKDLHGVLKDVKSGKIKKCAKKYKRISKRAKKFLKGHVDAHDLTMLTERKLTPEMIRYLHKQGYSMKDINTLMSICGTKEDVGKQVLSKTANLWLAKRYVYDTTMLDLQEFTSGKYKDVLEAATDFISPWEHGHASSRACIKNMNGTQLIGKYSVSIWGKPNISNGIQDIYFRQSRLGLVNTSNLWDIVPFSFMVDWFTNLGDFFSALDTKIHLGAGHYEFDNTIMTWSFTQSSQYGPMKAFIRRVTPGCSGVMMDAWNTYSASTRTWLKRVNDFVAILVS
jgi:hypothetical protein